MVPPAAGEYERWMNYIAQQTGKPEPFMIDAKDPGEKLAHSMRKASLRQSDKRRSDLRWIWLLVGILAMMMVALVATIGVK